MITAVLGGSELVGQTEKFDIASFTPPKGWQRMDSNGVLAFQDYRTTNGLTSFCQIILYPSRAGGASVIKEFNEEWNTKVKTQAGLKANPTTETEKTPEGWTVVKGYANINQQGISYTCILAVVVGFNRVMSVRVNLAGQDQLADVENFFKSFEMDKDATSTKTTNLSWENYSFIAPERWYIQKTNAYILLSQSQTVENGCTITILPPIASSGNLEADAKNIFSQMYPAGWQFRYTGEKRDLIAKGITLQGLEYCMMEAPMHKMRPDGYYYDYEDGSALVIKSGSQIIVISGRHNRLIACFCNHQYEYWKRFFNSFNVKNAIVPKILEEDISKRIIGDWMAMGGSALTEYIFAANGNYQFIGAYATTTKTTSGGYEYLNIKTSGFKGDGAYSIKGNQLIITKHGSKDKEQYQFRFEKSNPGGAGWRDRLYMLKNDVAGTYEVCYEKQKR